MLSYVFEWRRLKVLEFPTHSRTNPYFLERRVTEALFACIDHFVYEARYFFVFFVPGQTRR